ncbi:hypothetical protein [Photobacterium damselae]|uniref:hypothetical protein n=1 Tax=Photobacterium damselae TaxID=38293 RepID=UPI0040685496
MKFAAYLNRKHFSNQQANLILENQDYRYELATRLVMTTGIRPIEIYSLKQKDNLFFVTGKNDIQRRINIPQSLVNELKFVKCERPVITTHQNKEHISDFKLPGGSTLDHKVVELSKSLFGLNLGCAALRNLYVHNRWEFWYSKCCDRELAFQLIQLEVGDNFSRTNEIIKSYKNSTIVDYERILSSQIIDCSTNAIIAARPWKIECFSSYNIMNTARKIGLSLTLEHVLKGSSRIIELLKHHQWQLDFANYQFRLIAKSSFKTAKQYVLAEQDLKDAKALLDHIYLRISNDIK